MHVPATVILPCLYHGQLPRRQVDRNAMLAFPHIPPFFMSVSSPHNLPCNDAYLLLLNHVHATAQRRRESAGAVPLSTHNFEALEMVYTDPEALRLVQ